MNLKKTKFMIIQKRHLLGKLAIIGIQLERINRKYLGTRVNENNDKIQKIGNRFEIVKQL